MKSRLLIPGFLVCVIFSTSVYADYLVSPSSGVIINSPMDNAACCPVVCHAKCHAKKYHRKKQFIKRIHRKSRCHRRYYLYGEGMPVCSYYYHPQPEISAVLPGCGRGGRWVNLIDCSPYDPDMSTGDDDPTVYPGMNINN